MEDETYFNELRLMWSRIQHDCMEPQTIDRSEFNEWVHRHLRGEPKVIVPPNYLCDLQQVVALIQERHPEFAIHIEIDGEARMLRPEARATVGVQKLGMLYPIWEGKAHVSLPGAAVIGAYLEAIIPVPV